MSVDELLFESKTPTTRKNYVGVEIEFIIPRGYCDKLKELLLKENLQWNVHLGGDGSVIDTNFVERWEMVRSPWNNDFIRRVANENDRPRGKEIRILATEREMPEYINKVCEIIRKCKGYVNDTCGLHVHLDMRNRKVDHVYNNLYALQSVMFKMQPKGRRKNKYCGYLTKLAMQQINRDVKNDSYDDEDRYYSVNKIAYAKHRTLEIRLHEGSIDPTEIRKWVYFLIKLSNLSVKLTKRVEDLNGLDLPEKIKEYVNARIAKFAG